MTSNHSKNEAIALKGVSKDYGPLTVLQPIDLSIRQGEFLTLLGPSGSGKTTLLSLISGAISATAGTIFLGGRDITGTPPRDRGIGMVFQNYALMPHMTVFQNVAYPLRVRGESAASIRKKVADALDRVGLSGFDDRKPRQLSGGQQQRVGIARCIVYSPSIIMMDEPLGALDKNLREQMQGEIKRLHRELGTTLIYVTHDQEEALNMSDRICLMKGGSVAQLGTPDELYFHPQSKFVAEFIGESNLLAGVRISDGQFRVEGTDFSIISPEADPKQGGAELVMVRPEKIVIVGEGESVRKGMNSIPGRVASVSFVGGMTRVGVDSASGLRMTAKVISGPHSTRPEVGASVKLVWAAEDSVSLAA